MVHFHQPGNKYLLQTYINLPPWPISGNWSISMPLENIKKIWLTNFVVGEKKERPITFSRLRRTNGQVHNSSSHSQDHRTTCFTRIKLSHLMSFWLQKCKIIIQWRDIRLSMVQKRFKISQSSVNPCLSSII